MLLLNWDQLSFCGYHYPASNMKELIYFIFKKKYLFTHLVIFIIYLFYTDVGMADMIFNLIYC